MLHISVPVAVVLLLCIGWYKSTRSGGGTLSGGHNQEDSEEVLTAEQLHVIKKTGFTAEQLRKFAVIARDLGINKRLPDKFAPQNWAACINKAEKKWGQLDTDDPLRSLPDDLGHLYFVAICLYSNEDFVVNFRCGGESFYKRLNKTLEKDDKHLSFVDVKAIYEEFPVILHEAIKYYREREGRGLQEEMEFCEENFPFYPPVGIRPKMLSKIRYNKETRSYEGPERKSVRKLLKKYRGEYGLESMSASSETDSTSATSEHPKRRRKGRKHKRKGSRHRRLTTLERVFSNLL